MFGYRRAKALRDYAMQSHRVSPRGPKPVDNLKDLDVELQKVDQAFAISDDEGRKALEGFCYSFPDDLPADPYSRQYQAAQMRRYHLIAGHDSYLASRNEQTKFDLEQAKYAPFPYFTSSPATVGDQLMAQGFLIRTMGLRPGARIVEFGAGWGNLTLHLVQMGYRVTAVEICEAFLDLIQHRAAQIGKEVELVHGDMLEFEPAEKYDAACFFESFHHCSDHLKMLQNLHKVITDEGLVAFAGEPIVDLPYPWGLRLAGFAVWSTRRYGWLEWGFDLSYFLRTLLFLGWTPRHYPSGLSQLVDVIIARKSTLLYTPAEITLPPDEDRTWAVKEAEPGASWRFSASKSIMSCARDVDAKRVEFCLSNYAPLDLEVTLSAGIVQKGFRVPALELKQTYTVPVRDWRGQVVIQSRTWQPSTVLGTGDTRTLGIAVESIRVIC